MATRATLKGPRGPSSPHKNICSVSYSKCIFYGKLYLFVVDKTNLLLKILSLYLLSPDDFAEVCEREKG